MSVKRGAGAWAGAWAALGVGVTFLYFFDAFFYFLLTQILISCNLHQLCIVAIHSAM